MVKKDRDRLIRTFQKRTSGRPNTTPANLTKKPGLPAARSFDRTQTFTRYGTTPPGGKYRGGYNRREDDPGPRYGNPNIIPGYGQAARKRHAARRRGPGSSYRSPSAYGRGGPQWN